MLSVENSPCLQKLGTRYLDKLMVMYAQGRACLVLQEGSAQCCGVPGGADHTDGGQEGHLESGDF